MSFVSRFIHDFIQARMPDVETRHRAMEHQIRETEKYAEKMYAENHLPFVFALPCAPHYTPPGLHSKTMYREPLMPWGYWKSRTALAKVCWVVEGSTAPLCFLPQLYDRDANPHVQRMPGHSKGVDPW